MRVLQVKLEDVHPSLEVVDAFREVSGAFEEKNRLINEARAIATNRWRWRAAMPKRKIAEAASYSRRGGSNRAEGDAEPVRSAGGRVSRAPDRRRRASISKPSKHVLPGKKKLILDKTQGRRHLFLLDDGVELPNGLRAVAGMIERSARTE